MNDGAGWGIPVAGHLTLTQKLIEMVVFRILPLATIVKTFMDSELQDQEDRARTVECALVGSCFKSPEGRDGRREPGAAPLLAEHHGCNAQPYAPESHHQPLISWLQKCEGPGLFTQDLCVLHLPLTALFSRFAVPCIVRKVCTSFRSRAMQVKLLQSLAVYSWQIQHRK